MSDPTPPAISPIEETLDQTQDVSARVQNLMRAIDRLPAGMYELVLTKPDMRAANWEVNIVRLERIETLRLSKYNPE